MGPRRVGLVRAARRRSEVVPVVLAVGGVLVGCRLLLGTYTLFQHAFLDSYWALPGARVNSAYWSSVRFAFQETVLVAAGVGLLTCLAVWEMKRAVGR